MFNNAFSSLKSIVIEEKRSKGIKGKGWKGPLPKKMKQKTDNFVESFAAHCGVDESIARRELRWTPSK